ncbi:hypothetical protein AVEN_119748-1 [Araneus ventricosus]|uniref:Uncharacterized protein n=1 Tax=Araneus ventricosus TaxID=182803 RepID=A0A4Y2FHH2_ARAVE|nr:hypothetical protein AVEN_119748-1 [Araneus ventricosus]
MPRLCINTLRGIVKCRANSTTTAINAVRQVKPFEAGRERSMLREEDNILSNPVRIRERAGDTGFRRTDPKTTKRIVEDVPREERKMGPACNSRKCQESRKRGCDTIPGHERQSLFYEFWLTMSWYLKICLHAAPLMLKALNERLRRAMI